MIAERDDESCGTGRSDVLIICPCPEMFLVGTNGLPSLRRVSGFCAPPSIPRWNKSKRAGPICRTFAANLTPTQSIRLRRESRFIRRINHITPVQSSREKYFAFAFSESMKHCARPASP
jgi:hypothetical protein